MKFELKTENENYSKSLLHVLRVFFIFSLGVIFCDVSLKLGIIARQSEIDFNCRRLYVNKDTSYFKKLSKLSKLKSKQRILDFCRTVIK